MAAFAFDNTYARLPERFYAKLPPARPPAPKLIRLNAPLAELLGADPAALSSADGVAWLSGRRVPDGAEPLAMAYAGHQFGGWVPQLGDGRAILLGEVVGRDGVRRDIQLKGAGRTPFSRRGDGRAALGPVLREYMVSEGMAALGVPTTRALAALETGEQVARETMLPGGVVVRVARSHVRVGTFQYFYAREDVDALRLLADYVIDRHYPDAADAENPYCALLDAVVAGQAALIAQWMGFGFIHGVMNTDNMSVAAETIDYGPCAFMDVYRPDMVYSSIDQMGRYAYANQPSIGHWNLAQFAQCLLPLIAERAGRSPEDAVPIAQEGVNAYADAVSKAYLDTMRAKIGLADPAEDDMALIQDLLRRMAEQRADFTLTFRRLSDLSSTPSPEADAPARALFADPTAFDGFAGAWRARLASESRDAAARQAAMRAINPIYIPRNHLVEAAIDAAVDQGDVAPFHDLVEALAHPYDERAGLERYARPPEAHEVVRATFCGT